MIFRWYRPTPRSSSITRLYGAIVAQARTPAFYRIYQVPDTVNARLEMIMLHVVLVLLRLRAGNAATRGLEHDPEKWEPLFGKRSCSNKEVERDDDSKKNHLALGQCLFDEFCRDMDASMREMGVGDLAVPRKMRRIGDAFYARQATYGTALTESDNARLTGLLHRNIFAGAAQQDGAERLATYSRAAVHLLAKQERFERAELAFPDPGLVGMRG
jgi:cytochrome b pre-mRNA-processing protein 3